MDSNLERFQNESEFKNIERNYKPKIKTLFNFTRNPIDSNLRAIEDWVYWAYECSLMSEDQYSRIKGTYVFMNYFYPFCSDEFLMETLIKLNMLIFVWDDHTERYSGEVGRSETNAIEIWSQFEDALEHLHDGYDLSMAKWKPYSLAMYTILEDMYITFNDEQKRRFITVWKDYVRGNIAECHVFDNNIVLTVAENVPIRRNSICVMPFLQAFEYSQRICLSDEEWNGPMVHKLHEMATDCMLYVNDIWSFEKEFREQDYNDECLRYMNNVVANTVYEKQCSIVEAITHIMAANNDLEERTIAVMHEIMDGTDVSNALKIYVNCVYYAIGANCMASSVVDRFNKYF